MLFSPILLRGEGERAGEPSGSWMQEEEGEQGPQVCDARVGGHLACRRNQAGFKHRNRFKHRLRLAETKLVETLLLGLSACYSPCAWAW